MTDDNAKAVEAVARALVKLDGFDPDEQTRLETEFHGSILWETGPRWKAYERKAREHIAAFDAIMSVRVPTNWVAGLDVADGSDRNAEYGMRIMSDGSAIIGNLAISQAPAQKNEQVTISAEQMREFRRLKDE